MKPEKRIRKYPIGEKGNICGRRMVILKGCFWMMRNLVLRETYGVGGRRNMGMFKITRRVVEKNRSD